MSPGNAIRDESGVVLGKCADSRLPGENFQTVTDASGCSAVAATELPRATNMYRLLGGACGRCWWMETWWLPDRTATEHPRYVVGTLAAGRLEGGPGCVEGLAFPPADAILNIYV